MNLVNDFSIGIPALRALPSIFSSSSFVTRNQPVRLESMISHEIIAWIAALASAVKTRRFFSKGQLYFGPKDVHIRGVPLYVWVKFCHAFLEGLLQDFLCTSSRSCKSTSYIVWYYSGTSLKDTSEVWTPWLMRTLDWVSTLYNYFPHEIRTLH